jgi:hypothetical protein
MRIHVGLDIFACRPSHHDAACHRGSLIRDRPAPIHHPYSVDAARTVIAKTISISPLLLSEGPT